MQLYDKVPVSGLRQEIVFMQRLPLFPVGVRRLTVSRAWYVRRWKLCSGTQTHHETKINSRKIFMEYLQWLWYVFELCVNFFCMLYWTEINLHWGKENILNNWWHAIAFLIFWLLVIIQAEKCYRHTKVFCYYSKTLFFLNSLWSSV